MPQPLQAPDPWPERELNAQGSVLPNEGPGHTVTLTQSEPSKGILALIVLGAYLFAKYVLETSLWTTRCVAIIAGGIALLISEKYRRSAWKIRVERSQVLLWEGSSPRIFSFKEAKKHLAKDKWVDIVISREIAISMSWRRAQLATWEWLRHTSLGKKHRDKQSLLRAQEPGTLPSLEVFAVDADRVRFVDENIWIREKSQSTQPEKIQDWLLNADEVRKVAPTAELILVARTWNEAKGEYTYDSPPRYLAGVEDSPAVIRTSIAELGHRALPEERMNG